MGSCRLRPLYRGPRRQQREERRPLPSDLSSVTPAAERLAARLIRQYRCEASIEALSRYHDHRDAGEASQAEAYRNVLGLLGVPDHLLAHRPGPEAVADLYRRELAALAAMQRHIAAVRTATVAIEDR